MQPILKLVLLLVICELLYRFKIKSFLLGYGAIYQLAPFLLQPNLPPDYECLLKLCEEVADINHYHQRLQEELEVNFFSFCLFYSDKKV